jgi:hypothetical protein
VVYHCCDVLCCAVRCCAVLCDAVPCSAEDLQQAILKAAPMLEEANAAVVTTGHTAAAGDARVRHALALAHSLTEVHGARSAVAMLLCALLFVSGRI